MYRVIAYDSPTDTVGHTVYDPRMDIQVIEGKLTQKENDTDDLQLTVGQSNYLFGRVQPLQTHVEVYSNNSFIFRGRALDVTRSMKSDGSFVQSFVFESIKNYLQDSSQRWYKYQNYTPKEFFQSLINNHNAKVPKYKQFIVGKVDVTNSTDNVYRFVDDGATTWDAIKDKLLDRLGGYIKVTYENGTNYIDYVQEPGRQQTTGMPIQVGVNLQSSEVNIDPTEVITQLVPLGATIERDGDENQSRPRVDIKTVNNNKDYIEIPELEAVFGVIRKAVVWEDIHEPAILKTRARQWIEQQKAANESWTIEAVELPQFYNFKVSDSYLFTNDRVATSQMLRVVQQTIDFAHPNKSTLTIANKSVTLSEYQAQNRNAMHEITQLHDRIENQSTEIGVMNTTIKEQQTIIDRIDKDLGTGDLVGIKEDLKKLSGSINTLSNQVANLNYVTPAQLTAQVNRQANINDDFETRIAQLERK